MHTFNIWAPLAKKVEVRVGRRAFPMTAANDGQWTAQIASASPGHDYGFLLDGEGPFPDPRSSWQPQGVHQLSRVYDHRAFKWTDADWQAPPLAAAVIYELHIGTFTPQGTFDAAVEKLDHLVQLGITHVELMPVAEFSGARGWGYDGVDLFAPHHTYGGPEELKRLVNACHQKRLAVLLDVVYNHLGPSGNYLGRFGPYFNSQYSTPWGAALNFDKADSEPVRRFFCDNALMWLRDYHFDGLRLDAVHAIVDTSAEPFLAQLGAEVEQLEAQLGRHLVLIAESDLNDPRLLRPRALGGCGLQAQWCDDFHHALHTLLTGERNGYYADFGQWSDLAKALRQAYVYDGRYSKHRRRRHGRPPLGLSGHQFMAYLQNHDQVGNRARGERIGHLINPARLKIGAALVLTSAFVPLLFQGEEWAASAPFLYFTDHQEPQLAQAVREGRRQEFVTFGWKVEEIPDPQARETFQQSVLDWSELSAPAHAEILEWYRQIIDLRRREPSLADGHLEAVHPQFDAQAQWFVVERGPVSVVCNFGRQPQIVPLSSLSCEIVLTSASEVALKQGKLRVPAEAVAIVKKAI